MKTFSDNKKYFNKKKYGDAKMNIQKPILAARLENLNSIKKEIKLDYHHLRLL